MSSFIKINRPKTLKINLPILIIFTQMMFSFLCNSCRFSPTVNKSAKNHNYAIQQELCKYTIFAQAPCLKAARSSLISILLSLHSSTHSSFYVRWTQIRSLWTFFSFCFFKTRNLNLSWIIVIKRHSHLTLYLFKYLCYFISKLLLCFPCFLLPHLLT